MISTHSIDLTGACQIVRNDRQGKENVKTMKRPFREAICTCTSARSLMYQSLVIHKPKCLLYASLLAFEKANVKLREAVDFVAPTPTILENKAANTSHLTPAGSPLLA